MATIHSMRRLCPISVLAILAAAAVAPGCGDGDEGAGDGDGDGAGASDGDGGRAGSGDGDGDGDSGDSSGGGDGGRGSTGAESSGESGSTGGDSAAGGTGMGEGGMDGIDPDPLVLVQVAFSGSGSGTVVSEPAGLDCSQACDGKFADDVALELTATADQNSVFVGWSGDCTTTSSSCVLNEGEAAVVTASFELKPTLSVTATGGGSVVSDPAGIDCPGQCEVYYEPGENTVVTLTPEPEEDRYFVGWSGDCVGSDVCEVAMNDARSVTATFADSTSETMSCTMVADVSACTNGPISNTLHSGLTAEQCQTTCETALLNKGIGTGCWVLATNNVCYCRSGELRAGTGSRSGGVCTIDSE